MTTNPVDAYAADVVAGRVPAGKYHRLACQRHLDDRARESAEDWPYRFEWTQAERFLSFARKLKHYKGRQFAGLPFEPTPVQVFRLGSVFGWRDTRTGYRRFTTAYNELPRKTGKSFEAAAVGVYCTFFEGEPGAEGYCIATKEQQARIVFDAMKRLVKSSGLSSRIHVGARSLYRESSAQKMEPLGSDSDTTDGLNPHLIVTDELHAWKTRGLLDVMESATGARVNPLHFQITTAGDDPVSPCGDQHEYACRILDGTLDDDASTVAFFAFIAHADEGDDPWSEATWIKANPHWGISVNPEDMRKLAAKAQQMPSAAAEFKQKRLNLWVNASAPCLSVEGWKVGQTRGWSPAIEVPALRGEPCYVGIDLASKIDLCALSLVFPPTSGRTKWRWVQQIWTPADTLADRAHRDRAPYGVWVDQGWLMTTDGKQIDRRVLVEALEAARAFYDIQLVGLDPWHSDQLETQLVEAGFDADRIVEVPQTYAGMSSACLRVQADILGGDVDAGGCPVTAWCVGNVVPNIDGKGNLMFAKGKSRGRIDPVIAGTIATALWLRQPAEEVSVYESRGLATIGGPHA